RIKEELRGEGGTGRPQIERAKREGRLPVSFAQQRLWFLDQLEPGSPFYNSSVALKIIGDLNITVVKRAINEIVRRHEVLRTSFRTVDGQPVQIITPQLRLELPVIDLEELSPGVCMREAQRLTNDEARSVIDITQPP